MGIRSMVQFAVRVAAFTAVLALLLQISCMSGVTAITTQVETHSDSGCHEYAPAPKAPDSNHVCCSGDHSPDVLLSAFVTPASLALDETSLSLNSALPSFALASIHFPSSVSPPRRPLTLRI